MIKSYLDQIAKVTNCPNVHLYRRLENDSLQLVTDRDFCYGKPDVGYGARLQPYLIKSGDITITSFSLYEFPSCCAFCVSTQVKVEQAWRKRGVNKIANQLRQYIARMSDYTALICTDVDDNIGERKTLQANGFRDIFQVKNKRTGNIVNISVKLL